MIFPAVIFDAGSEPQQPLLDLLIGTELHRCV